MGLLLSQLLTSNMAAAQNQREQPIRGDRLSGFVIPIEPLAGEIELSALRANAWSVDDTRRLLLTGDVSVSIAGRVFQSDAATLWINRVPSADGLINQIAAYFDQVTDPTMPAGSGVAGRNLLVTGSTRGEVTLDIALLVPEQPRRTGIVARGEDRLEEHLRRIAAGQFALERWPQVHEQPRRDPFTPQPGREFDPEAVDLPRTTPMPVREDVAPWLGAPEGSVRYSAEEVQITSGEKENIITLLGPLVVDYVTGDPRERWQQLTLTAQRAVIFTDPAPLEEMFGADLSADSVRGIYLEGNVIIRANVDDYVIRSPRVYYDFRREQAIMLDAVMRTYTRDLNTVVYSRASELRQVAENQWIAQRAQVSTSEFFKPHIAVGANRMTITERPADARRPATTHVDARDITLRSNEVPFFYWPRYATTLREIPLQSISMSSRDEDGISLLTTWNLFTLLGVESPGGVRASLKLDGFARRGAGAGVEYGYNITGHRGLLDLYGMYDDGIDRTTTGRRVDPDRDFRGVVLWEHTAQLNSDWTAQFQTSWISDESFIAARREDDFRKRREYETSAYLKGQTGNHAFTLLTKYELNDFISNDYLLASRQYQVDKLPEITYRRYGDALGNFLTYSTENRLSRVRLVMQRTTPAEAGVPGRAFGIGENDRIDESLRAMGLPSHYVNRADTRHEFSVPMSFGPLRVVPFIVGRYTAYDDDFSQLSDEDEKTRAYIATGVTFNMQLQHVNNAVESRLFDLHRMRHVIEPRFTMWYGYSTLPASALPIYDQEVEGIGEGTVFQFGVRNKWQTQRGGPGNWRSVDFLTIDTAAVFHSSDVDRQSPTPQFFEYRPEYSQFGDHVHATLVWLLSDNLSVVGEGTYDLDNSLLARGAIGAQLQHSPALNTFVEYRYIEASDNQLLDIGWNYRLTPKYRMTLSPQWDLRNDEFRAVSARVIRSFPDFDLIVQMRYDKLRDDLTIGATIGLVQF